MPRNAQRSSSNEERDAKVLHWLLEESQPAVRYRALLDLQGRGERDLSVRTARAAIGRVGWAATILHRQSAKGFWERREPRTVAEWVDFLYKPPFTSTIWNAQVLAELGMDVRDPRIRKVADLLFNYKLRLGSPFNFFHEEVCIVGNTARMLTLFGLGDDPRVRRLRDWILEDQRADGGWNCSQGTKGTLDVWEGLAALAAVPEARRLPAVTRAIERGAEFYLKRRLLREGSRYDPWLRFHFPNFYFYDVLVGLDLLTQLGYADDRRLAPALAILRGKRRKDGTWAIDRAHPDLGKGVRIHPDPSKCRPLILEAPGGPSKWVTLKAMTVLQRVEQAS